jgi:DNA-binding NarL/FixJ family response regulator
VLTGLEALTASARRAAGLAAAGMSNPKIAQPLVVTLNTVGGQRRQAGQELPVSRGRLPPGRTGTLQSRSRPAVSGA